MAETKKKKVEYKKEIDEDTGEAKVEYKNEQEEE